MRLKYSLQLLVLFELTLSCWTTDVPPKLLKEVKSGLLSLFGFKERPEKIHGRVHIPDALRELYQVQDSFDLETTNFPLPGKGTGNANTVHSFLHTESLIDNKFKNHHRFRLKFDVSLPQGERLQAAEIKLVSNWSSAESVMQRVVVEDIIRPGIRGRDDGPITRIIDSKLIDLSKNKIINLDVLPAVERWLENPTRNNHGLLVTLSDRDKAKHIRLKRQLNEDSAKWALQQPILLTYTDDGKFRQRRGLELTGLRKKRAPRKGHRKGEPCRRHQMYVNFHDVGWSDWIVAPLGYEAFYCSGTCDYPMPEHLNTTNHAIVQSLMNSARPNEVPKPCCVPTQLSPISMLYVDSQNKVILKNYKDMVVIGCGCR